MVLDLIALGILLIFAAIGAARGGVASGWSVASLVIAYGVAIYAASVHGALASERLGLPVFAGGPAAGSLGFLVAYLGCGLVGMGLKRWDRGRLGEFSRGAIDRLVGAFFGALRGSLVVVLVVWLAIWMDAARELGVGARFQVAPETSDSRAAAATGALVEQAIEAAVSGSGGRLAGRMAARPGQALKGLRALLEDQRIQAVQDDPLFWAYVQNGAVQSALNRGSFWRVVNDPELRGELADLGLIDAAAAADPQRFREAAGEVLTEIGPRLRGLSDDPEIQQLARDPEIIAMLESGDTLGLLGHPGIQRVVGRVSAEP